jgi:hypothetical protein
LFLSKKKQPNRNESSEGRFYSGTLSTGEERPQHRTRLHSTTIRRVRVSKQGVGGVRHRKLLRGNKG